MSSFFGPPSTDVVLTSVFMALEGAFAYSAFLPSIMTIGTFVDSEEKKQMIREGEVVGTLFLGGLALTVALIMKSAWPAVLGLGAGLAAVLVYEHALQNAPVNKGWVQSVPEEYHHVPIENGENHQRIER